MMSKFYFTYGTDPNYPYRGGWTEVEAPSLGAAIEIFQQYHPDRPGTGCVNCAFYYTQEQWDREDNVMRAETFDCRCHERIGISREVLEETS